MTVGGVLKSKYPADVVDALLAAYAEIEHNFFLRKWKASELDAGHFVEAARRILEHALFGAATPIGTDLSKFNDTALKRYENATGDDSLRILIPRILWSVYGIRNKRGVGHVGPVSPNEMDSAMILAAAKWVLAEFVRLASGLPVAQTQELVDQITERRLELLWKHGDITRVLNPKVKTRQQVLLLLYDTSPQTAEDLRRATEYRNVTDFKEILGKLHGERLIEHTAAGLCIITTRGLVEVEAIVRKLRLLE